MIKYALQCDNDHRFEIWFASSDDYTKQQDRGFVSCPSCDSSIVEKELMAPSVQGTKKKNKSVSPSSNDSHLMVNEEKSTGLSTENAKKMRELMRAYRSAVEENADYVGKQFAEEARKIHYGEVEERGIYGETTLEEVSELVDEGINIQPLPILPEDHH